MLATHLLMFDEQFDTLDGENSRRVPKKVRDEHAPYQGSPVIRIYLTTIALLVCSNVFMTFAWYGHLKNLPSKPWIIAALASWGIAFFEYLLQVPANRTGHAVMTLGQLKILQEIIALTVFVPFALIYMREKLSLDYVWASFCIAGAAYFIFRNAAPGAG